MAGIDINGAVIQGNAAAVQFARNSKALSDADYTLLASEYAKQIQEFTGVLTATRTITAPLADGAVFYVANLCSGGSLTFKVTGQTGVTIAAGKRAAVYCNATDYVRITPDT